MNTESKIWTALSAMGNEANTSVRDLMVGDALNELAEMQAEIAHLRAQLNGANAIIDTLREAESEARGEVAKLRAALKPFVALARFYAAGSIEGASVDLSATDVTITVGDCRAVLKALGEEG